MFVKFLIFQQISVQLQNASNRGIASSFLIFFYYRSICIIDSGASRRRTRNARFRARRADHSTCQKLDDTQVETIRKIQLAFGSEALSQTQVYSNGLNALKMAVHQWRVIPAWKTIHQLKGGGNSSSSRKSAGGSSLNGTRNCCKSGNKHWLSSFHPY